MARRENTLQCIVFSRRNYCDSYKHGLGVNIIKEIKNAIKTTISRDDGNLKIIDVNIKQTAQDTENFKSTTDLNVSNQNTDVGIV